MNLGEYIKQYRMEHGLSLRTFAAQCGGNISHAYISMIENGKDSRTGKKTIPGIDTVAAIARGMGLTLDQLIRAVDADEEVYVEPAQEVKNMKPLPEMTRVPIVGRIACGTPIFAQENLHGFADMPKSARADFALTAVGDSMIGARIHDGDLVFIRQQPEVENGEIAAVLIGEEATLKRVYLQPGRLTLVAENPAYPPMVYVGEELNEVRILGKAVSAMISLEVVK